jgi:hypothetical protein
MTYDSLEFLLKQSLKSQFPRAGNRVFCALGVTGPTGRSVPLTSLKTHGHPWKPIGSAWLQGNWEQLNPPRLRGPVSEEHLVTIAGCQPLDF